VCKCEGKNAFITKILKKRLLPNFKMAVKVVILYVLLVLCGVVQCLKPSFQRNTYVMMAANDLIAAGTFLVQ